MLLLLLQVDFVFVALLPIFFVQAVLAHRFLGFADFRLILLCILVEDLLNIFFDIELLDYLDGLFRLALFDHFCGSVRAEEEYEYGLQ